MWRPREMSAVFSGYHLPLVISPLLLYGLIVSSYMYICTFNTIIHNTSIIAGLKVYFWLWEHLCHQVEISRRTAKILGAQLKMLGAQLKILVAPKRKIRKLQTLVQYSFISMLSFISILCLFLSWGGGGSFQALTICYYMLNQPYFSISGSITLNGSYSSSA